jgi:hypothetical protein
MPSRDKPPPPVVAYEAVTVACGHVVQFRLFEDRKDRYRADRRKKLIGRACKACRAARQQAEQEALEKRRAERAARAQAEPSPKKSRPPLGRLPDGSRYDVAYDATAQAWSGTLTIPGREAFTASASGVFTLLSKLDGLYRATLPEPAEA